MRTNHPFAVWAPEFDNLNVIDDVGHPRCGTCGLPRGIHPDDESDEILGADDLRRSF
jgi:hypothetical protein